MSATAATERSWFPSFWLLQICGWLLLYLLLLAAALPHLGEQDIFLYNTAGCAVLFFTSLALRPLCRMASKRWLTSPWTSTWITLEAGALAICLLLGGLTTVVTGLITFGWKRLDSNNWMLSWLQTSIALFLWCSLYVSIKQQRSLAEAVLIQSQSPAALSEPLPEVDNDAAVLRDQSQPAQPLDRSRRFAIRTGSRIRVVNEDDVLWISSAGDYVELHTAAGTHLLRETMTSLQRSLNPATFVRIHRSRIVRWNQINEMTHEDNGDYRVRLRDGSEHRSSRTFSPALAQWLHSGQSGAEAGLGK
jgi:hypothetical protein